MRNTLCNESYRHTPDVMMHPRDVIGYTQEEATYGIPCVTF